MRIISQDGFSDLPYEQSMLYIKCEDPDSFCHIHAQFAQLQILMGSYVNLKRASEVLRSLRMDMEMKNDVFYFPQK